MKKIRIWWRARILDYPYWRVTYRDGKRTFPLHYAEAYGLSKVFGGKLWVDYTLPLY